MSGSRYQLADTVLFHYVWYQWDSVFVHSHFSVGSHSYGQCFYCFGFLDSSPQTKEDILSCHQLNSCRPSCWIHCNTWDRSGSCSSATKQNQSQGRLVQFIGIPLCLFHQHLCSFLYLFHWNVVSLWFSRFDIVQQALLFTYTLWLSVGSLG